jgi:hypothetical protein
MARSEAQQGARAMVAGPAGIATLGLGYAQGQYMIDGTTVRHLASLVVGSPEAFANAMDACGN